MVRGLNIFRDHFSAFQEHYVLIGGAAVDVLLSEVGLPARATKDLDVVLLVEAVDGEFGEVFWDFIEEGGYSNRSKSTGEVCFYRFHSPSDQMYPMMIELLSRRPDGIELPGHARFTPLPLDEEIASLSAILLDDDYYEFVRSGVVHTVEGLALLGAEHLVLLKARAWLDLTARKEAGEHVNSGDIKKHRTDIVRLWQLIPPATRVSLPEPIRDDLAHFLDEAFDDNFNPKQLRIDVTAEEITSRFRDVYGLGA